MSLQEVISQLESIRDNSANFLDPEEPDSIWQQDIDAIDEVLDILKGMKQQSRWKSVLLKIWHRISYKVHEIKVR